MDRHGPSLISGIYDHFLVCKSWFVHPDFDTPSLHTFLLTLDTYIYLGNIITINTYIIIHTIALTLTLCLTIHFLSPCLSLGMRMIARHTNSLTCSSLPLLCTGTADPELLQSSHLGLTVIAHLFHLSNWLVENVTWQSNAYHSRILPWNWSHKEFTKLRRFTRLFIH